MRFFCNKGAKPTFETGGILSYKNYIYGVMDGIWVRVILDDWPRLTTEPIASFNYDTCNSLCKSKWQEVFLNGVNIYHQKTLVYESLSV